MDSGKKYVIAFVPAFNEEEKVGEAIREVKRLYAEHEDFVLHIIVVDDGSSDRTSEVATEAGADRVVSHPQNLGLGAATRTGMRTAYEMGAHVALKLDADLQHDPGDIERVVRPILEDRADIVYGSRFAGEITYKMPLVRRWGNRFFTWLMRKLTGWNITDAQTGLMVYSRRYLADFKMPGNYNPPQQTLIDAYHKHMRYAEVPVVFRPRTSGKSFVSMKYPFKVFPQIVRSLVMVNPLRVFMPAAAFLLFLGLVVFGVDLYLVHHGALERIHDSSIMLLILFGLQTGFFGLLADLVVNKR